jgi:hypothetical protein
VWCCGQTCDAERQRDVVVPATEHLNAEKEVQVGEPQHAGCTLSLDRDGEANLAATKDGYASTEEMNYTSEEKEGLSVEAKSCLVWRDEWECDFCGPECFCWTVDTKAAIR